jgi:hypothetical protein
MSQLTNTCSYLDPRPDLLAYPHPASLKIDPICHSIASSRRDDHVRAPSRCRQLHQ